MQHDFKWQRQVVSNQRPLQPGPRPTRPYMWPRRLSTWHMKRGCGARRGAPYDLCSPAHNLALHVASRRPGGAHPMCSSASDALDRSSSLSPPTSNSSSLPPATSSAAVLSFSSAFSRAVIACRYRRIQASKNYQQVQIGQSLRECHSLLIAYRG